MCHVAAVKRLLVLDYNQDYIFISFRIIEPIFCYFENGTALKPVLGDVYSLVNYTAVYEDT